MVARSVMVRPALLAAALALGCFVDASTPTSEGAATSAPTSTGEDSTTGSITEPTGTTGAASTTSAGSTSAASSTGEGSTTSAAATCGDGVVDDGEECDSGPENGPGMACKADCRLNVCGDSDVGPGEVCDDGNTTGGDGCSPTCSLESLYAFLSQGKINGNAGTIGNVDAKCQSEASAAGLPGKYLAWITFGPDTAPALRFADHDLAVILPGGDAPMVAQGRAGLLMAAHQQAINRFATGGPVVGGSCGSGAVWTGTLENGEPASDNCLGFSNADAANVGAAGVYSLKDAGWSAACDLECSLSLPFYCVQQP